MMKVVSFTDNAPLVHTIPAVTEEEYPATFYTKEEIEQFRHESVLEMMGVPLAPSVADVSPTLGLRKMARMRRDSTQYNVKSETEVLAELASSSLYKTVDTPSKPEEENDAQDNNGTTTSSRPVRERRGDAPRRETRSVRERRGAVGDAEKPDGAAPARERRQRAAAAAGDGRPQRNGSRIVRGAVSRERSVITALPAAPPVV